VSDILASLPPDQPLAPGRYGAVSTAPAVKAATLDLALATLSAGRSTAAALSNTIFAGFGITLPQCAKYAAVGGIGFTGIGPGRWIVSAEKYSGEVLLEQLQTKIGAFGSACDQSDGSVVFELTGSCVRDTLAKMVDIDIDPVAFSAGSAATTPAALIGATLWQTDGAPTFRIAVARSYAPAFLRALAASAAEYGFEYA
jgi:methylglutamate dehydrogenase subunit D